MPTTNYEAEQIVNISTKYLSINELRSWLKELNEQVGDKTDNSSLKESLIMLRHLVDNYPVMLHHLVDNYPATPPLENNEQSSLLVGLLCSVVVFHSVVIFGVLASLVDLLFNADWFISLPLWVLVINFMFSRVECPLTTVENYLRKKCSLPVISGFIGHYFIKPIKIYFGVKKNGN